MSMEKPTADELKARRKAWVEALRSERFKQCTGALAREMHGEFAYCCLGVGCVVAIELGAPIDRGGEYGQEFFDGQGGFMPFSAMRFYGLRTKDGQSQRDVLTNLNACKSFSEIADFIESNPPGLWTDAEAK